MAVFWHGSKPAPRRPRQCHRRRRLGLLRERPGARAPRRPAEAHRLPPLLRGMVEATEPTLLATLAAIAASGGEWSQGRRLPPRRAPWRQRTAHAQVAGRMRPMPGAVAQAPEPRQVTTPPTDAARGLARAPAHRRAGAARSRRCASRACAHAACKALRSVWRGRAGRLPCPSVFLNRACHANGVRHAQRKKEQQHSGDLPEAAGNSERSDANRR